MANETKVGVTAFAVLLGVFGYVLWGKYEHRLAALAGTSAEAPADPGGTPAADPLPETGGDLGDPTDPADAGAASLADFGDETAGDAFAADEPAFEDEPAFGDEPNFEQETGFEHEPAIAAVEPGEGPADEPAAADWGDAADWGEPEIAAPAAAEEAFLAEVEPAFDAGAAFGEDEAFADHAGFGAGPTGGNEAAELFAEVVPIDDAGVTVAAADPATAGTAGADGFGSFDPVPADPAPADFADDADADAMWGEPTAVAVAETDPAANADPAAGGFEDAAADWGFDVAAADDPGPAADGPADGFGADTFEADAFGADAFAAVDPDPLLAAAGEAADPAVDAANELAEDSEPLFFNEPADEEESAAVAAFDFPPTLDDPPTDAPELAWGGETEPAEETEFPADPAPGDDPGPAFAAVESDPEPAPKPLPEPEPEPPFDPLPAFASAPETPSDPEPAAVPASDPAPALDAPPVAVAEAGGSYQRDDAVRPAAAVVPAPFKWNGPKDRRIAEVRPGESYWTISKRAYGSVKYFKALARYNARRIPNPRKLAPGMKVVCPSPEILRPYDPELVAEEQRAANPAPKLSNGFGVDERGAPVFVVGPKDTLGAIAQAHLGRSSRWRQIYALNRDKIADPRRLKPGTLLDLPADAAGMRRR